MPNIMGETTPDETREKALKEIRRIARSVGKWRHVHSRDRIAAIEEVADDALKAAAVRLRTVTRKS